MTDEEKIVEVLKQANIKYFVCKKHGRRVGYFYSCDECNREMLKEEKNENGQHQG